MAIAGKLTSLRNIQAVLATGLSVFMAPAYAANPSGESLVGIWQSSGCEAVSPTAQMSLKRRFEFGLSTWHIEAVFYDGAKCDMPLLGISVDGVYEIGGASDVPGASEGTFFYGHKTAWALSEKGALHLTQSKCGTGEWRVGLEQDISQTGCLAFGPITQACLAEYDLVAIDSGQLRFGARRPEMCRPDGRPTELSKQPVIRPKE